MGDDLAAERSRLMAEQERLLREGVPLEDLARLVDVGDLSKTEDEAPKVTTGPDSSPMVWCYACDHEHIAAIPALTFRCDPDVCGFGSWLLDIAVDHATRWPDHIVHTLSHDVDLIPFV